MATKKQKRVSAKMKMDYRLGEGFAVVDASNLKPRPKRRRQSAYEPVVQALLQDATKAVVVAAPEGKTPDAFRSSLYPRLATAMRSAGADKTHRVKVAILEDGRVSIRLVKR